MPQLTHSRPFYPFSLFVVFVLLGLLTQSAPLLAADSTPSPDQPALQSDLELAQKKLIELNRDLQQLETDLLFPNGTQLAVFLTTNAPSLFALDSVKVILDDSKVASHLYTDRELDALTRGASHNLYNGSLSQGKHHLLMIFIGRGPDGRPYRKAAELDFKKSTGTLYVELIIDADSNKKQPTFLYHVWP
jgi:hypothetical protein